MEGFSFPGNYMKRAAILYWGDGYDGDSLPRVASMERGENALTVASGQSPSLQSSRCETA